MDHLQQSSASELNLSVDLVNLLNRYGIQFADAASVGSFLSQLGIVGTDQQILISAAEDALPGDQNSVEGSVLQCNNGESEEGNISDANESAAETAFHPLGGDSSGVFTIVPSERELTSSPEPEANRFEEELAKNLPEDSLPSPRQQSSRLLSLKVEIADEAAVELRTVPPPAVISVDREAGPEAEPEAEPEPEPGTEIADIREVRRGQDQPQKSVTKERAKENVSPNVRASTEHALVESNGRAELTPKLLREILEQSIIGQDIIDRASKGVLSEGRQLELSQIVAEWHLAHRKKLYEENLRSYAQVITLLFRNEKLESYYLPKGGDKKNPGGKIYNKVNTIKSKFRKREKYEATHAKRLKLQDSNDIVQCDDPAANEARRWLNINDGPWTTVMDMWRTSYPLRRQFLGKPIAVTELEKINLWRFISMESGHQLVDIDYDFLKIGTVDAIEKWPAVLLGIGKFIETKSLDGASSEILQTVTADGCNQDVRFCGILLLLNCVLHPQKVSINHRPTIVNGQEDTIIFASTYEDAAKKVEEVYRRYEELSIPPTPKLVVFGKDYKNQTGVYRIYYKNLHYTVSTITRAIDVLIKFTVVYGVKPSKISYLVWLFIYHFVYGINRPEKYTSVTKLEEYLSTVL